ncbi:benzoate membrane transport protein [Quadrisphaera granulorum]|uniref:Benzoate membrane transport protein n=1 Tax=Quadrisphaera granulorum TaxID=317664 RepID=A0A315ZJK2_9ACTN|nr:benzoate/H(+) symporter BenE family transporter [Quadrisphaera granulorum]PWJ45795.1 benzoate membrane transport protein [Quadrisphaera granulorum]SZE99129.1 benzoate membrane transport protein [Quadrisphaera granulorum]
MTAVVAGLVAALVSFAGPFAVVVQATRAAGLDPAHTASWVWAITLGSGISGLVLSWVTRMPVIVAWSTPGAALLIASLGGFAFSDAVGAFLVASVAACMLGATGWFGRLLTLVPGALMSALLAGVLLPFVIHGATAVTAQPLAAGAVVATFLVAKRWLERYAVPAALVVSALVAALTGSLQAAAFTGTGLQLVGLAEPVWTTPTFDLRALLGIALPLLLVTMAAQNAPGLTVLRTAGYTPPDRLLVGTVSAVSVLLTPFGGHATNLAAITAAIAAGPDAHPDPRRRYVAGLVCGGANLLAAAGAGWLVGAYSALPAPVVAALAAVALLPALAGALGAALAEGPATSTAALVTIAVTASGVVALGVGSAFWAILAGVATWLVLRPARTAGSARVVGASSTA